MRLIGYGLVILGGIIGGLACRSTTEIRRAHYFALSGLIFLSVAVVTFGGMAFIVQSLAGGFFWVVVAAEMLASVAGGFFLARIAADRSRDAYGHGRAAALAFIPFANFWLLLTPSKHEISANRAPAIPLLTGGLGVLSGFVMLGAGIGLSAYAQVDGMRRVEEAAAAGVFNEAMRDRTLVTMAAEVQTPMTVDETTTLVRLEAVGREGFLDRLRDYRVLDPACGSGNFLYIALTELKNIEHRANLEAEALGLQRPALQVVGPENVLGIELNPYAAELARVSVWIGEIQWMRRNGFEAARNPILRTLTNIENRDAVLNPDGTRADWPRADAVVGNPPFLGDRKMIRELGEDYTITLRKAWDEVPGGADLVCYWFAKAWAMMLAGRLDRAGLVATNSIRGGANREVLKPIAGSGRIFEATARSGRRSVRCLSSWVCHDPPRRT